MVLVVVLMGAKIFPVKLMSAKVIMTVLMLIQIMVMLKLSVVDRYQNDGWKRKCVVLVVIAVYNDVKFERIIEGSGVGDERR